MSGPAPYRLWLHAAHTLIASLSKSTSSQTTSGVCPAKVLFRFRVPGAAGGAKPLDTFVRTQRAIVKFATDCNAS
jgi:hypothetical protein